MQRAFLSLYILIVAAIIGIGWGLDQLWQRHQTAPTISPLQQATLQLINQQLAPQSEQQQRQTIKQWNRNLSIQLQLYQLDELSTSSLSAEIATGKPVLVAPAAGNQTLYQRIPNSHQVIALTQATDNTSPPWGYTALTVVFYIGLAAVILFWLWPLSRDLGQLERQSTKVGKDNIFQPVKIHSGSAVNALANAFNKMALRINELLAARKEMTYAVSHELRTPLARMKFALQMASENDELDTVREQLNSIHQDVDALDRFVNDLLSYASFDQSEQALNLSRESFYEVCQAIVDQQQPDHPSVDVRITYYIDDDFLYCDWRLMELALTNLIQNGLRYTSMQLQVSFNINEGECQVTIEDDGPGIAEQDMDAVLQPFVRLQQAQATKGYGLGLAIVKRVMQWHGGSVTIHRSKLGGAAFYLRWPLIPAPEASSEQ